ncbi:hypothetical protein KCH_60570 [Kitasatospora cheerisanensis KCTC 2395]|uniref:Uncharacterized protein n=1 Tax=Kitasatospora cheerisanensis KCTC 2395 TaxID=1348663 RepID=A0A066YL98_9ACTN|nr:hypothetical protein KCH_60570 [Kitasatospora cheerisanensis KCTC 2395]
MTLVLSVRTGTIRLAVPRGGGPLSRLLWAPGADSRTGVAG